MPVENESFTTADLRLCFRICTLLVFSCSGSYFMSLHNEIATRERVVESWIRSVQAGMTKICHFLLLLLLLLGASIFYFYGVGLEEKKIPRTG